MPARDDGAKPSPSDQVRALYEQAESRTARAFEDTVGTPSFGALLAHTAENVAALTRIGSDLADLGLRTLRIAGRADIVRLARQLHRNEDKLERVLQEVEQLRDELDRHEPAAAAPARGEPAAATPAGSEPEQRAPVAHTNGSDEPRGRGRSATR
ncbi:MAG: hypothetical protein ABSH51_11285 [Solirubrobacteraceae bacterium]|jgi:hypothetical protein